MARTKQTARPSGKPPKKVASKSAAKSANEGEQETKKRRRKPGKKAASDVRKIQSSDKLLMRMKPFKRMVIEKLQAQGGYPGIPKWDEKHRLGKEALTIIQEYIEEYAAKIVEAAVLIAQNANRKSVYGKDLILARDIITSCST